MCINTPKGGFPVYKTNWKLKYLSNSGTEAILKAECLSIYIF